MAAARDHRRGERGWLETVRARCRLRRATATRCRRKGWRSLCRDGCRADSRATVDIIAPIDEPLPAPWPHECSSYDVVMCTEVLEHVRHLDTAFGNLRALTRRGGRIVITVPFVFPLHLEPIDFFRVTPYAVVDLARRHQLTIERHDRVGDGLHVASTFLADSSLLPSRTTLLARLRAKRARLLRSLMLALCESEWMRRDTSVNANTFLSNALVLRNGA